MLVQWSASIFASFLIPVGEPYVMHLFAAVYIQLWAAGLRRHPSGLLANFHFIRVNFIYEILSFNVNFMCKMYYYLSFYFFTLTSYTKFGLYLQTDVNLNENKNSLLEYLCLFLRS